MKNQIIGRFILAFVLITTASSTAQVVEIDTSTIPDEVTFPRNAVNSKFAPRGIFALIPRGEVPKHSTWEDPCLDGVTIRTFWEYLNPRDNEYDWKELDRMFELADRFSKKIHLMIVPGFYSPGWVIKNLAPNERTEEFRVPRNPYKGEKRWLPLPWSSAYLNMWFTFVEELGKRYGPNPALSLISITGPNSHNDEVNLTSENKWEDEFPDYDPIAIWKDLALKDWRDKTHGAAIAEDSLKSKMLAAYDVTLRCFYQAFSEKHEKYLSLQIFNESLPVEHEKNRQLSAVQKEYQRELITRARHILGKYFVLMNGGLEAWPIADAVSNLYPPPAQPMQWERIQRLSDVGYVTGLLQKDAVDEEDVANAKIKTTERELFRLIIRNGVRFGADFLVIMEDDIYDDSFRDLIAAGGILLKGKCK